MKRCAVELLTALALFAAAGCSTGFEVVKKHDVSRIEWYKGPLAVLPALTVKGTKLSDPNINRLFKKKLSGKYKKRNITNLRWSRESGELLTTKSKQQVWDRLQQFFAQTGWVNRTLLQQLGETLQVEYLMVPQVLTVEYVSWEFTGIFSYDSVYLAVSLYQIKAGKCRELFTVRSRGYSLAGLASAYTGAIEMVLRAL